MHLQDGRDVLVGDTPEAFAAALVRAYTDETVWNELAAGGIRNIEEHFSFPSVERAVMRSLETMVAEPQQPRAALPCRPAAEYALGDVLRFGHGGNAGRYLDGGWSEPAESFRWAVGRKAQMRLHVGESAAPAHVEVSLFPLLVPARVACQRLVIILPAETSPATITLSASEPTSAVFALPPNAVVDGVLTLQFHFPDACSPANLGLSGDVRLLSIAFLSLTIH